MQKLADLEGECPFLKSEGACPYGLSCRFLNTHQEGKPLSSNGLKVRCEVNGFSKDVQKLLWKNKMTFPKTDAKLKTLGLLVCYFFFFFFSVVHVMPLIFLTECYNCYETQTRREW